MKKKTYDVSQFNGFFLVQIGTEPADVDFVKLSPLADRFPTSFCWFWTPTASLSQSKSVFWFVVQLYAWSWYILRKRSVHNGTSLYLCMPTYENFRVFWWLALKGQSWIAVVGGDNDSPTLVGFSIKIEIYFSNVLVFSFQYLNCKIYECYFNFYHMRWTTMTKSP